MSPVCFVTEVLSTLTVADLMAFGWGVPFLKVGEAEPVPVLTGHQGVEGGLVVQDVLLESGWCDLVECEVVGSVIPKQLPGGTPSGEEGVVRIGGGDALGVGRHVIGIGWGEPTGVDKAVDRRHVVRLEDAEKGLSNLEASSPGGSGPCTGRSSKVMAICGVGRACCWAATERGSKAIRAEEIRRIDRVYWSSVN